ncbi:hypothetical protein XELAEV_18033129mg [Xenopus laevis]|uniref:Uncharacterized protein n=1 Tax=Xenopus laevis TaxID=8355 RepID=A0A974CJE4_XENLA|nr:hypothetical protein XELAEV_18033129mg [Xenopus laevis]
MKCFLFNRLVANYFLVMTATCWLTLKNANKGGSWLKFIQKKWGRQSLYSAYSGTSLFCIDAFDINITTFFCFKQCYLYGSFKILGAIFDILIQDYPNICISCVWKRQQHLQLNDQTAL